MQLLKVALVGCGKIAVSHAAQIKRLPGCEIVGVCNRSPEKAQKFCERFSIEHSFTDVSELLDRLRPDVVHITTPPASHFELARLCIEQGSHVYVEKPFTLSSEQALRLIELANAKRIKMTVGHNNQFSEVARRMRSTVQAGYLGGPPIHIDSSYSYDLGDERYAAAFLRDENHWVRMLPGKLIQNVISHGIARIAEYLTTDQPMVVAHGFASSRMKQVGDAGIVDELRVIISEEEQRTAYFTFSSQIRPLLHQVRLYGTRNSLILDERQATLTKLRGPKFKSYAEVFIPPVIFAKQHVATCATNASLLLRGRLHPNAGMRYLIEAFYRSIREDQPVPIPYEQIARTAWIMDAIIEQVGAGDRLGRSSVAQTRVPAR
jgi:predicted dehydrogenase